MVSAPSPAPGLVGRQRECRVLDELLAAVRSGESRVLVVRGEAGAGKSLLLGYAVERAGGCRVARATGVESEMELPYAGLHQICAPMLDGLAGLPPMQGQALRIAFGMDAGPAPDRFLVGLAVLGLLADAASERPLVCVVDDAQWLDRASAQTLTFVARRLLAESVGLLLGVRDPGDDLDTAGLPGLAVAGLSDADARALLASAMPGPLDAPLRDRLIAEARGNPLALLELPRGLTAAELAGGFARPDAMPLQRRIERSFVRQLDALDRDSRDLVLVAAAEPVGDVTLLLRAAAGLDLEPDAAIAPQAAGLLELGAAVRFRHPLLRSAVYGAASEADRRRVHRALGDAIDAAADPDRRAWHLAHAADRPDETLAAELERSAGRAQARGGIAAAAAFLERAAELTPDPARRGARSLAAAQAKLDAGASDTALALLATAEAGPLDDLHRARMERVRARVTMARTRGRDAAAPLLAAARRLDPLDGPAARETHLEALVATVFAGRLAERPDVAEAAQAARSGPAAPQPPRALDLLLDGLAARFLDGYAAGVAPLRRALDAFAAPDLPPADRRWLWLACRLAEDLWADDLWHALAARGEEVARETGTLALLPTAATYRAAVHVHEGAFAEADALIEEAEAVTAATGQAPVKYATLALTAWRGDAAAMRELHDGGLREALPRGEGMAIGVLSWAEALLHNGWGRHEEALTAAELACAHEDVGPHAPALAELVEAAFGCGRRDDAAAALERLAMRTRAAGTDWALGIEAGSRALLADADRADALHREAVERLARTRGAVHLARARLRYGEWLHAQGRADDAREPLRRAHEAFAAMHADGFADRARRALRAIGETVRARPAEPDEALTAQEAQISRLARDGKTNPEIGAQLFISPRTVEWHLRHVFAKLGISSRRELADVLPA